MPTYAYACTECDNRFEAVQSFSDDSLTVCPQCQGRLRKVFNSVGVVFKGSGFYRNDSRSSKNDSGSTGSGSTDSSAAPAKDAASTSASGDSGSSSGSASSTSTSTSTPKAGAASAS